MCEQSYVRVIGIDVIHDWLDLHCPPMGIEAERQTLRQVILPWRFCPRPRCRCLFQIDWRLGKVALVGSGGRRCFGLPGATRTGEGVCAKPRHMRQDRPNRCLAHRSLLCTLGRSEPKPSHGRAVFSQSFDIERCPTIEIRQRLLAQIRALQKLGTARLLEEVDSEPVQRIDSLIKELEDRIARAIAGDDHLSEVPIVFRSIPGIGPAASTMLITKMCKIRTITDEEPAALTGWELVVHHSGTLRGKRTIAGGRRTLRNVMFRAALVAAHHNPS